MKKFLNTYALTVAIFAAIVVRLALGTGMPLDVHAGATYDDAWCVRAASFISSGQWLGPYDDTTLIKAPGFPLFLAAVHVQVFGYGLVLTVLWTLSCLLFVLALRPLLRRRRLFFVLFAVLLFCPVSFATETFQRVYRNSITASQALLVFAGYLGMYLRLKGLRSADTTRLSERGRWRKTSSSWLLVLPWALVAALSLAWFWVTREDSVWIAPFVLVATVAMAMLLGKRAVHLRGAGTAACALLLVLPLASTVGACGAISSINQQAYGRAVISEINSGEFARAVKDLYAIEPQEQPSNQRVVVSHATLQRAYAASPTLAGIKDHVEEEFSGFGDAIDNNPGDGEVNGGEFFWVLRRAARDAGCYESAGEAEEFYGKVADEIEAAFSAGTLRRRLTWPSSLLTPWRAEYAGELLPTLASEFLQSVSYQDVSCEPFVAQGGEDGIRFFESQVNGLAYRDSVPYPVACTFGMVAVYAYQVVGPALALAGIVCAVFLLVRWAHGRREGADGYLGTLVLMLAALFLSALVLLLGLSYSRVSSFIPIAYYYYGSAAYPLLLSANALACIGVVQERRRKRREDDTVNVEEGQGGR